MKETKANCQRFADGCMCSEGGGEWQNGRNGHPSAAQLAVGMVPPIGARPPPVPLVVAGGRTDTTLTAAMAAAAAAVMIMVARVTVAAARGVICGPAEAHVMCHGSPTLHVVSALPALRKVVHTVRRIHSTSKVLRIGQLHVTCKSVSDMSRREVSFAA